MKKRIKASFGVDEVLKQTNKDLDTIEVYNEVYKFLCDGFQLDEIIETLVEYYNEEMSKDVECTSNGGLDPAFRNWGDCNSQFV